MLTIDTGSLSTEINTKYLVIDNSFYNIQKDVVSDKIEVEVGDTKTPDSFLPQIKMMRWDNEVNFSIRLVTGSEGTLGYNKETIKWIDEKVESNFYEYPDSKEYPEGSYEFELLLKSKPKTNKIDFSIRTKDITFIYQPTLKNINQDGSSWETDEEGHKAERPANVNNSYAVYHATRRDDYTGMGGKNYATGKAFHLYRPYAVDSNGLRVWCDLVIDEVAETMQLVLPQDFIDKAVYPVLVDPTLGKTSVGASTYSGWSQKLYAINQVKPTESGDLNTIQIYLPTGTGTTTTKVVMGVYSDNGDPNALLKQGPEVNPITLDAWNIATLTSTLTVDVDTYYWLVVLTNGVTAFAHDGAGFSYHFRTLTYTTTLPDLWGTPSTFSGPIPSFYASFVGSGAAEQYGRLVGPSALIGPSDLVGPSLLISGY